MSVPRDPVVEREASERVLDLKPWVTTYVEAVLALDEPDAGERA